jgi:hypothetical protein
MIIALYILIYLLMGFTVLCLTVAHERHLKKKDKLKTLLLTGQPMKGEKRDFEYDMALVFCTIFIWPLALVVVLVMMAPSAIIKGAEAITRRFGS